MKLADILEQLVLDQARDTISLPELVAEVLGAAVAGESVRRGVERILARRFTAEQGQIGAKSLSRSLTKQIDGALAAEMTGVTVEQRRALLRPLVDAATIHLVEAAQALSAYLDAAVDYTAARAARDTSSMVATRRARTETEQRLDKALLNAGRALTGAERV